MRTDITDRAEVTELVYRLGLMIDEKRFDQAASILAPDVSIATPGGRSSGLGAVVEQARRTHEPFVTQHLMTNVVVEPEGDVADVRAQVLATFVGRDDVDAATRAASPGSPGTRGARYRFRATRLPEGWRIADLSIETLFTRP